MKDKKSHMEERKRQVHWLKIDGAKYAKKKKSSKES